MLYSDFSRTIGPSTVEKKNTVVSVPAFKPNIIAPKHLRATKPFVKF